MNDETLRQLTKQKDGSGPSGGAGRKISELVAYRSVKDIPPTREMAIQVSFLPVHYITIFPSPWQDPRYKAHQILEEHLHLVKPASLGSHKLCLHYVEAR